MTETTRRTLLPIATAFSLLLMSVAASAWLLRDELADLSPPVAQVALDGELHYLSDESVLAIVRPLLGERFLRLDVARIQTALSTLPWLREVTVRKRWPDGVMLYLTEREPQARWHQTSLIDRDGTVFRPPELTATLRALPEISGETPERGALLLTQFRTWSSLMTQRTQWQLVGLTEDARGAITLRLAGGVEVLLGRQDVQQRLTRLLDTVPRALGEKITQAARIDLRYRDGFAVAWRQSPAESTAGALNG